MSALAEAVWYEDEDIDDERARALVEQPELYGDLEYHYGYADDGDEW